MQNNVCSDTFWYGDMLWAKWLKFSKSYIQIIWKKWGDDIINSLICIFISTFPKKNCWKLKILYLPYIFPIYMYMKFSMFCSKFLILSIKLNLLNPILTGLFESKFLLGGPPSDLGPEGADRCENLHGCQDTCKEYCFKKRNCRKRFIYYIIIIYAN